MKIVKESIKFQRGGEDIHKSMGIGKEAVLKKKGDEIRWEWHHDEDRGNIVKYLEYRGIPMKVVKSEFTGWGDNSFYVNIATGIPARSIEWVDGQEYAIEKAKRKIDNLLD